MKPVLNTKLKNIYRKTSAKSRTDNSSIWDPSTGRWNKDNYNNRKKIQDAITEVISKNEKLYAPPEFDELLDMPVIGELLNIRELLKSPIKSPVKSPLKSPIKSPKFEEVVDVVDDDFEDVSESDIDDEDILNLPTLSRSPLKPLTPTKEPVRSPQTRDLRETLQYNIPSQSRLGDMSVEDLVEFLLKLDPQEFLNCIKLNLPNTENFKNSDQYKLLMEVQKDIKGLQSSATMVEDRSNQPSRIPIRSPQKSPNKGTFKHLSPPPKSPVFDSLTAEYKMLSNSLKKLKMALNTQISEGQDNNLILTTRGAIDDIKKDLTKLEKKMLKLKPDIDVDDYSFGKTSPQPYRRIAKRSAKRSARKHRKFIRRSNKKYLLKIGLNKMKKSLKKIKKFVRKPNKMFFGHIYGLQTPMEYNGVFPLDNLKSDMNSGNPMARSTTLPTLSGIKRDYVFGRRRSNGRRRSVKGHKGRKKSIRKTLLGFNRFGADVRRGF